MTAKTEIVHRHKAGELVTIDTSPSAMLARAVEQGATIADLQGMMDLQERWEANNAKKAFVVAMSKFKKNVPAITRNASVEYNTTKFDFASLDHLVKVLDPALAKQGLSFNWTTTQADGLITVTCTLTHVLGHSESTSLSASPDQSGGKNNIQAVGSTNTYLQRYTLRAITGTAEGGTDTDGNIKEIELITENQSLTIQKLITDHELDVNLFRAWLFKAINVESIEQIPADKYRMVIAKLNEAINKRKSSMVIAKLNEVINKRKSS